MAWLRRINKIWILLALCLALYLPGLTSLPATDRDEARYMQATRQMLESGDFIDIRFQDEPRYKKPVGIYWLQAGMSQAASALGVSSTARGPYRLPSTLGATGAVLALYLGFRSLIGEREAFISAVFLSCTLLLGVEAHLAKTDAMQLAGIITMQAGLARLYCSSNGHASWPARLLFWLGLGLSMLIKGPVAPAVAAMTLAWICWKERSFWPLRELRPWPWLAIPILIVGPWLLSIQGLSDGQFVRDSLAQDFLAKILEGQEEHGAPPGTYLLLTPFLLWPVSWLLIPKAWLGLFNQQKYLAKITTFLVGWLVPSWLLFELVPTKLPHYVLPLIPALCLLGGIGFIQASPTQGDSRLTSKWPEKIGFATWILAGTIIALGLPTLSILATGRISAATLLTCLACIAALALTLRLRIPRQRLAASAASAVVIFGLIFEFALPGLTPAWPAETMRKTIASRGLEGVPISISEFHEPSAVFNLGTQTKLTDLEGVIAHSSSLPEAIAIVPSSQASELKQKLPKIIKSRLLGHINGFNYSKGKSINLDIIYTNQAPGSQPQANK